MSTFNKIGKMVAIRMHPDIYNSLNLEISDINSSGSEKYQDKNVNKEVMINAILISYLSRAKDSRRKVIRPSLRVLENMMDTPESLPIEDQARLDVPEIFQIPDED